MIATTKQPKTASRLLCRALAALGSLAAAGAVHAAVPGISGGAGATATFNLQAQTANLGMPDGQYIYSWGYGCSTAPAAYVPAIFTAQNGANCGAMQVPGPTLVVTEGQTVTVNLTNNLPPMAGNTSILFPGFNVTTSCNSATPVGAQGLLTCEATPGSTVSYTFTAQSAGTRAYYSGTQSDLQIEMGLYGAVIVLPATVPAVCSQGLPATAPGNNAVAKANANELDGRLSSAAYNHPEACYDREYLFQWAEVYPNIHVQAYAQVNDANRITLCKSGAATAGCSLDIQTEPFHPQYFLINGRSMPDNMDPVYSPQYPSQPYNGNPHMHPGEVTLLRVIGQGRWQHPFHEHANHVRILARDGNMILSPNSVNVQSGANATVSAPGLAGAPQYTTPTTPGQSFDGLFTFTGRGLNWDMFGHHPGPSADPLAELPCTPDVNGFNTGAPTAINYFEWCADHNKPVQSAPFGDVASGGPMSLPDPNSFKNGPWYSGSIYFGPDALNRAVGSTGTIPPSGTIANSPSAEAGWAFMWHSHNERELTTNNAFPGGMLMMLLIDSREFVIDETQ